jgi:adenosylcobinamide-phosphate synthase
MTELVLLILAAFLLDLLAGDPVYPLHPVRIMGWGIETLERGLRRSGLDGTAGGWVLAITTVAGAVGAFLLLSSLTRHVHPWAGRIFHLYVLYSCLALEDLFRHVQPVVQRLKQGDLPAARLALSRIVGRDAAPLDRGAVGRAAVETLAENFVDGFLSPLFWLLGGGIAAAAAGLPVLPAAGSAVLAFKAASTLDSMVGYRNDRYNFFGRAGARLDDVMNFVPARLSIPILFVGAALSGLRSVDGVRVALRDRLRHDSPNAAHAESFAAGALGVRLGGPARYGGAFKDKAWLGSGTPEVDERHVLAAVTLLRRSSWALMLALLFPLVF